MERGGGSAGVRDAALQVEQSRRRLDQQAQEEVLKLALAIAERVTKRRGELDPNVLSENAVAAMKLVVHSTDLRIAVHPSQRQLLLELLPRLALEWPNFSHVELVDDEQLSRYWLKTIYRQRLSPRTI